MLALNKGKNVSFLKILYFQNMNDECIRMNRPLVLKASLNSTKLNE